MAKALKTAALIVGAVALVATGVGAVALGGLAGALTVGGISTGTLFLVSGGLTVASSLLQKTPKVAAAQTDRLNATIDPRAFRKTILGQTAWPVEIRYEEWSGKDQEYCDWIVLHASHASDGLDEIWFENEMVWSATTGVVGKWAGYFSVPHIVLEGSAANAFNIGSSQWNRSARLTGCTYSHWRFKVTGNSKKAESPFSSGLPSRITVIGRGAKLYDPRRDSTVPGGSGPMRAADQSTWRYTADDGAVIGENLALHALRVALGWRIKNPATGEMRLATGSGVPARRLNLQSWIVAANLADEQVNRSAGGTEPRYHGACVISEGDDPKASLDMLCAACCGRFRDSAGKLSFTIAHNDLAGAAIDDGLNTDDVIGAFTWDPDAALEATPNIVRGKYVDASVNSLYQMIDYPEVRLPSPDGQDRIFPLDLGAVESPSQAQRIAKQVLQRKQYPRRFSAPFDIRAWKYSVGDVVPFTFAPLGFTRALFRVEEQELGQGGTCNMTLLVENASLYAWDKDDAAPVQAAEPIVYDNRNNPLILAIADAATMAEWPLVADTAGTKPENNATNSADPDSAFGPDGTVGEAKQKLADMDATIAKVLDEIEGAEGPTQAAIAARDAARLAATNSETARDDSRAARDAAQTANEEALASAKTAAGSAGTAEAQAKIATTKADDAGEQATIAKGQATIAVTSAGEASTSASNAATSEKNASGSATSASTQAGLSATSAKDAASSATAASGSAGTASTKADQAGTSASAADSSRTAAQTAAGDAATYRDQASTSASGAAGSASTASTQAGLSAGSARDAANSATAANTSASTASTKADAAGVSATAASVSAQEAKGYRDGAASSATSASGSAVAADGSRASAQSYAEQAASSSQDAGGSAGSAYQSSVAASGSAALAKSSADLIAVVGGNLLSNSDFASGTAGWSLVSNSAVDFVWGVDNAGFTIPGDHYQGLLCTKQNGDLTGAIVSDWVAIRPGDWVQISAWLAARESHSKLRLQWAGGGGAYLRDGPESDVVTPPTTGWENLDGWARVWCKAEAPSDARFARLVLAKGPYLANPNGFLSWAFMLRPMLALATASQVAPSPYQPASGGAGVQALSAKVSTVEGASVNALTRTSAAIFRKTVQAGNGQAGITIFALDENGVVQSGVLLEGDVRIRGNLLLEGSVFTASLGPNAVSSTRGLAGMGGSGITSDTYGETPRLRLVSSGGQIKIDVQSDGSRSSGAGLMTVQLWAADTRGEFALSREVAFSPSQTAVPVAFWHLTDFAAGSTVDLFLRFYVKSSNTSWSFSSAGIVATELKR